jgi:ABC-type phosphate transport system auxiliary subunit
MGGFLARMGLIQNAALDHVNLFWPFPIISCTFPERIAAFGLIGDLALQVVSTEDA